MSKAEVALFIGPASHHFDGDLLPASRTFLRVFSYSTAEAVQPFLTGPVAVQPFRNPQSFDGVHEPIWAHEKDRGFLTIINGNKVPRRQEGELYSERMRAVAFFGHGEVGLYGIGWDVPPDRTGETAVPATARRVARAAQSGAHRTRTPPLPAAVQRAYRGAVDDKAAMLGQYRFAICFENMLLEGWITEKLFDRLYSGTVPVYLGAPDIEGWMPPDCFNDVRDIASYDELRAFLHSLGPAEVTAYREVGRDFMASERVRPLSREAFAELFGQLLETDAGLGAKTRVA